MLGEDVLPVGSRDADVGPGVHQHGKCSGGVAGAEGESACFFDSEVEVGQVVFGGAFEAASPGWRDCECPAVVYQDQPIAVCQILGRQDPTSLAEEHSERD
jgi:hypothetical protein